MKKVIIITASVIACIILVFGVVFALGGIGSDSENTLVFESGSANAVYDGSTLKSSEWKLAKGTLKEGHTASVDLTGSQTDVGESKNTMSVVIKNEDGEDVSDQYDISLEEGTLSVTPRKIEIRAKDTQKVYDGLPLECEGYDIVSGELVSGHIATATYSGKQTGVGVSECNVSIAVADGQGKDKTSNYEIASTPASLTVTKRKISLVSATTEKIYDATPLSDRKVKISEGELVSEHSLNVSATAKITNVGEVSNSFTATVLDLYGNDVTENYEILYTFGKLRVTPAPITVYTDSDAKVYDGTPLTCNRFGVSSGMIASGETLDAIFSAEATDVGFYENKAVFFVTDVAGEDTTKNYSITVITGALTVQSRRVVISSLSDMKQFDGTPLVRNEVAVSEDTELVSGHSVRATYRGEQLYVGTSKNEFDAVILNGEDQDVTKNYDIKTIFGNLTVSPTGISIQSPNELKIYDGQALEGKKEDLIFTGELMEGHRFEINMTGSQTESGESNNTFTVFVLDENDRDFTYCYNIMPIYGKLTVLPKQITLTSPDIFKTYDGTPLKGDVTEITIVSGELLDGHTHKAEFLEERTVVGTTEENTFVVEIYDANGDKVTSNYDVQYIYREIIISPITLVLKSASDEKEYDGKPLTNENYEIVFPDTLPEGETLVVVVDGERTSVGESPNTFKLVDVVNSAGESVLFNYVVEEHCGTLVVTGITDDNAGGGGGGGGSGGSGGSGGGGLDTSGNLGGGGGDEGEAETVMQIKSDVTGNVYMRLMSYGDFDLVRHWMEVEAYQGLLDGKYSYNYLSGNAIGNSGMNAVKLQVKNPSYQYFLPYYLAMEEEDYIIPTNDVMFTDLHDGEYSLMYYPYSGNGSDLPVVSYSEEELSYREFVYENYLNVDEETRSYLLTLIAEQGFDKDDANIVDSVARYIQTSAKYDLKYDTAMDKESNVIIAFLRDYKTGVCRHYASAATLMFRTLGIPARYTIGYAGSTVAGEWTDITSKMGHAWVEIYLDGVGWITVEVTGSSDDGSGGGGGGGGGDGGSGGGDDGSGGDGSGDSLIKLDVYPIDMYMKYHGEDTVLTHTGAIKENATLTDYVNKKNYSYEVEIEGEIREIGYGEARITKFVIYNADGEDVTETEFKVTLHKGKIQIYEYEITVVSGSAKKVYDGTPLSEHTSSVSGYVLDGHNVSVKFNTELTDVGSVSNSFGVTITDENGDDVTYRYKINHRNGKLEVTRKVIYIEAGSAEKLYDGEALTCNTYEFVNGTSLVGGHKITVVINGAQTKIGECSNVIVSAVIVDTKGKIVTDNYTVHFISGILSVYPPT